VHKVGNKTERNNMHGERIKIATSCWLIQLKVWWCTDLQTLN